MTAKIFGWFNEANHTAPTYDPGLLVNCPFCDMPLSGNITTISLMLEGDSRSYFYRAHAPCYHNAMPLKVQAVDSAIIDAVVSSKNVN